MSQASGSKLRPKIVGTGLFALDMVLDPQGNLLSYGLGGSAGNVLSILAKFNWDAVPVAEIGDDTAGHILLQEFTHLNADKSFIQTSASHTPIVYQHMQAPGCAKTHEFSFACPHCGKKRSMNRTQTSLSETKLKEQAPPKVFYLDRATLLGVELAEFYQHKDVLVVFEPSQIGKDPDLFQRALDAAHIVKYADDRLGDLQSFETAHITVEICTMGSQGLRYRAPSLDNDWVILNAYKAPKIIDTAGAGDWTTAGMIHYLLGDAHSIKIGAIKYNQLYKALRYGQALSALNCMTIGAQGLSKTIPLSDIKNKARQMMQSRLVHEIGNRTIQTDSHNINQAIDELLPKKLRCQSRRSVSKSICCSALT